MTPPSQESGQHILVYSFSDVARQHLHSKLLSKQCRLIFEKKLIQSQGALWGTI